MRVPSITKAAAVVGLSKEGLRKQLIRGTVSAEPDGTYDTDRIAAQLAKRSHPGRGRGPERSQADDGYHTARAAREAINARIRELDLRKRTGDLLEASAVRSMAFEESRRARNLLRGLPARLAAVVAGLTDPADCHRVIEDEVNRVLDELAGDVPA